MRLSRSSPLQQVHLPQQVLAQGVRLGGELRVFAVFTVVVAAVASAALLAPFHVWLRAHRRELPLLLRRSTLSWCWS